MWARVVEFMIGCWLAMSPFVFGHRAEDRLFWATDLTAAAVTMTLALVSFWHPLRHAHLAILLVAAALIGMGRFALPSPIPPAGQNHIITGLLLLMFAIIPNRASDPPAGWLAELQRES